MEQKNKYRFDEEANLRYEVSSPDELTPEKILYFVNHHFKIQRPRLDELDDYYQAKNMRVMTRKEREPHLSDYRAGHAYARYVSAFMQGYLVGNNIKVTHTDPKINEALQALNQSAGLDRLNSDIVLDLSIYGRAYDMPYRNRNDEDKVALLSPLCTFIIYDDTVEHYPLTGIRYSFDEEGRYTVDAYTDTHRTVYRQEGDSLIEVSSEIHYFSEVPITEYTNNRFRQGDFEPVLDLIDLYDFAQSDTANYMTDLNNAMLVIKGNVDIDVPKAKSMKDNNLLLLIPASTGEREGSVDAQYIYKQYDVAGSEAYKNRLQNDIHKFTNTPDLSDEKFSGNTSGEAMKYKLFGLEQVRATKETLFIGSAMRRYRLISKLKTTAKELNGMDLTQLEFIFTPNVPKSFKEEVEIFLKLGGELSQETIYKITDIVKDAKAEMERVEAEHGEGSDAVRIFDENERLLEEKNTGRS